MKNDRIQLDQIDKVILAYLQRDGRTPYSSIADVLGVSSGTVRMRVKRLEDEGYLKIVGVTDPFRTGIDIVVFFSLRTQRADIKQVVEDLTRLEEVRYAAFSTGAYDVIGIAMLTSRRDLLRFMDKELSAIRGIRETDIALLLEIRKQTYDWAPWADIIENSASKGSETAAASVFEDCNSDLECETDASKRELDRELDDIDKDIIKHLQINGRYSFAQIASELNLTERTIRRRATELRQAGILRIVGVTNPFRVGMNTVAVIGVKVDRQLMEEILSKLCSFREVRYVALGTGVYDIIFEAVLPSNAGLRDFLIERLAEVDGILQTDTSLVLEICKQTYSWGTG